MITFKFKVGKSFLKYTNHPITIPRAYNKKLVEEIYDGTGKNTIKVRITTPTERIIDGEIYYGIAGWGPFYQIKVLGNYPSDYFGNIQMGDVLNIAIKKGDINIQIIIEAEKKYQDRRIILTEIKKEKTRRKNNKIAESKFGPINPGAYGIRDNGFSNISNHPYSAEEIKLEGEKCRNLLMQKPIRRNPFIGISANISFIDGISSKWRSTSLVGKIVFGCFIIYIIVNIFSAIVK